MPKKRKKTLFYRQKIGLYTLILLMTAGLFGSLPFLELKPQEAAADLEGEVTENLGQELVFLEENSLLLIANPANPEPEVIKRLLVIVTGYSSTEDQTDSDPFITAAGTWVKDGIVANNFLPFGTRIKIPEIYGDKVFVVEDRMHWTKSNYHIDIWFPSYWEALNFGAKRNYIEVLEN